MTRLVDADDLKQEVEKLCNQINSKYGITIPTTRFIRLIDNAPTVVAENATSDRPQGEWYHSCEKGWECSQCHEVVKEMPTVMRKANYNFCPNCGAKMTKGGVEE